MLKDYENRFEYLIAPAKVLTEAYQNAARHFDEIKEIVLIEHGLVHTSDLFHKTAHWFPSQFDAVGDILHQRHIIQHYGATPEFTVPSNEMGTIFAGAVAVLDDIDLKLLEMISTCDSGGDPALGRQFESLQIAVSEEREKFLTAWKMYEETDSASSFDNWVAHMEGGGD